MRDAAQELWENLFSSVSSRGPLKRWSTGLNFSTATCSFQEHKGIVNLICHRYSASRLRRGAALSWGSRRRTGSPASRWSSKSRSAGRLSNKPWRCCRRRADPICCASRAASRSRSAVGRSSSILSSMSPTLCSSFETGGTGTGDRDWSSSPEAARREPVAGSLPWSPRWPNPPAHNRPCSEPSPRLYRLSLHRVVSAPSQTGAGVPVKQNARLRWRSHRYPYPGSLAETHERGR